MKNDDDEGNKGKDIQIHMNLKIFKGFSPKLRAYNLRWGKRMLFERKPGGCLGVVQFSRGMEAVCKL